MSEMIERVADAIADTEVGYSMTLVRLVDGVSTYSLRYDDGETLEFGSSGECYEHINGKKRAKQARAAIQAMRDPSFEMMQAMYEAMFVDKWNGSQAPMIGAGFEAAIDAALSGASS